MTDGTAQTGQDERLFLEFGIDTDKNAFEEARNSVKALTSSLSDMNVGIDLSDMLSSLKTAAGLLKGAVALWNSLEDKALTVSYNTLNYLPYNLDAGTRKAISEKVESSKLAERFNITPSTILEDLDRIIFEQSKVMVQGKEYSPDALISVVRLAEKVGNTKFDLGPAGEFEGSKLADLITTRPSLEVYENITGLLADAYRMAYSFDDKSTEREELLQFIKQVEQSPFVSQSVGQYISEMTEPNVPGYSKRDNPAELFWGRTIEQDEEGEYMKRLKKRSGESLDLATDLGAKKAELEKTFDQLKLTSYTFLAENLVLPFLDTASMWSQYLTGRKHTYKPDLDNFDWKDTSAWKEVGKWLLGQKDRLELFSGESGSFANTLANQVHDLAFIDNASDPTYIPGRFALSRNWMEGRKDIIDRKQEILASVPDKELPSNVGQEVGQELALYEVMRMGRVTYQQDAQLAMAYYIDKIKDDEYFKDAWKGKNAAERRKAGYTAVMNAIADENSPYYLPPDTGFLPIYNRLYETKNISEKDYLRIMGEVFANTQVDRMKQYYGSGTTTGTDIISATVEERKVKGQPPEFNLVLTIKEEGKDTTRKERISIGDLYSTSYALEHSIKTEY